MTDTKHVKTMTATTRMPSSKFGNPRYMLHFDDAVSLPLSPDSSAAYGITNRDMFGVPLEIVVNGRGHVTYVRKVSP